MKKILFLLLAFWTASLSLFASQKWPQPYGHFNDFAHVVPASQAQSLEDLLTQVRQRTGAQIAVVTVPSVEGGDIDGAAVDLFKAWGIGQKGKDDGLLILVAIQDHRDRIEVGYGLESVITDGDTGTIRRHVMEPLFKKGEYGQGLTNGVLELAKLIESGGAAKPQPQDDQNQGGLGFWGTIILFIFIFILFSALSRRGQGGFWGGGFYGGGFGGGGFGGGGGGFGGFSGGGSGGGGSSGSW
jgi:uncharacterized protein